MLSFSSSFILLALLLSAPLAQAAPQAWSISPLSPEFKQRMEGVSWRPGCPVARDQLRQVELKHFDFQGRERQGRLVVHERVALEVVKIFQELHRLRFPIEKITVIEEFGGDDSAAMAANATTAFNCRPVAGRPGRFSQHSYGHGMDINPVLNPYFNPVTRQFSPPNAGEYIERLPVRPGMLVPGGKVVKLFESLGWTWGGRWKNEIDYQHFDKRQKQ